MTKDIPHKAQDKLHEMLYEFDKLTLHLDPKAQCTALIYNFYDILRSEDTQAGREYLQTSYKTALQMITPDSNFETETQLFDETDIFFFLDRYAEGKEPTATEVSDIMSLTKRTFDRYVTIAKSTGLQGSELRAKFEDLQKPTNTRRI